MKNPRLVDFLQLALGLLMITWFIWLRLLRPRLPKDWAQLMDIPLGYTASMVLIFILSLVLALNKHFHFWHPRLSGSSWQRYTLFWILWIRQGPEVVFEEFWNSWTGQSKTKAEKKLLKMMHLCRHHQEQKKIPVLIWILHLGPRIWISWIFAWEIVVLGQLKMFYSFILVLMLPIIFQVLKYILKEVALKKRQQLEHHVLVFRHLPGENPYLIRLKPPSPDPSPELFDPYFEDWFTCDDFLAYAQHLEECGRFFSTPLAPVLHYHYLWAWSYLIWEQMAWILR